MAAYDEHYQGAVQPIRLMEAQMTPAAFQGFLRGNIIKYAVQNSCSMPSGSTRASAGRK